VDEHDEGPWAFMPPPAAGLSARDQRERERERRLHAHVSRRKEQGAKARPRDRGLTREEIVAAAIGVADSEGVEAVSMRRIARELNASVMSLYWHVASKEELKDLMLESIEAEIGVPDPSGNWRADIQAFARSTRAALLRHEWAMEFKGFRPPTGPKDAQNAERLFALLDDLGADTQTLVWIAMTVGTYVLGAVLRETQEKRFERETAQTMASMTEEEFTAVRDEFSKRIVGSGRYPHIVRFLEEGIDPDSPATRDARFEFGLDCLLDGITARLPQR
jgi:AcrR family transcriptional regulator